jgi:hypothetical protein
VIEQVRALCGELPVHLSCNAQGAVWVSTGHGRIPSDERRYLDGRSDGLDEIVKLVLRHRSIGGKFTVSADGVLLNNGGTWILRV